jgi:hypothetical protein
MPSNNASRIQKPDNDRTALVIAGKALGLFFILNFLFLMIDPLPALGRISAYNRLFPGRVRLPYGDNPQTSYNLSLFNLDAMLASHELWGSQKPQDEFRVILIGDSATWGFLLPAGNTLSAYINERNIKLQDGKRLRAYNLGYPVMSLTKDLLFLDRALQFDPDLIIWPVTLESFPKDKQLFPPLLQNNPQAVRDLISQHKLDLKNSAEEFKDASYWDRTITGARRSLADIVRLQLYGVMWAATGIDQDIPDIFTPRMEDLPEDLNFHEYTPPHLDEEQLAFDVLGAGIERAGNIPVLILNEPMFVSQGMNSDLRYNFYYPRWAFDDFRRMISEQSKANNWNYFDFWDAIDPAEFTNSAIHMTPEGTSQFAVYITDTILEFVSENQ